MKIRQGFRLRQLGKTCVVIPEGKECVDFNKMISLNGTAAFLWEKAVDVEFDEQMLAGWLVEEYGIEMELALNDCSLFINQLNEAGVISA